MKFTKSFAVAQLIAASQLYLASGHGVPECLESVDPNIDYFRHKVAPTHSENWDVEYHNTYKIARNLNIGTTYVLYQCGSEPPTNYPDANATVQIPLTSVGLATTSMITFMEQLDLLDKVDFFLSAPSTISSPCFREQVESGSVVTVSSQQQPVQGEEFVEIGDAVVFGDGWQTSLPFKDTILAEAYSERTNRAIFDWVKFYSLFFNMEEEALKVTNSAEERFECTAKIAAFETSDAPKPTVLWGSYSAFCGGWQTGTCANGNYYCEFAELCEAEILTDAVGTMETAQCGVLMSTEEFVEFGKDAEYWIYVNTDWDTTYNNENFTALLDTMKSVQDQNVFDWQGSGPNAWFEERLAQYYDVLQDFCHTVGTTPALDRPNWFRNVFTELEIGNSGTCVQGENPRGLPFEFDGVCLAGTTDLNAEEDSAAVSHQLLLSSLVILLGGVFMW